MRFHVVSLPHTQTTQHFSSCAFTEKVRKFCRMMTDRGHTVFLYAGEKNEAPCEELIVCAGEAQRIAHIGDAHYTTAPWDPASTLWRNFNAKAITGIMERYQPRDFICLIGGTAQKPIADAFPHPAHVVVEFGIGYAGTFARYRVWESYAWMHTCYGAAGGVNPSDAKGDLWFDEVIPGYLEPETFPYRGKNRRGNDYFLFVGRMNDDKGIHIASEVCREIGKRIVFAGPPGKIPAYGEYIGVVGPEQRGKLMAGATALLAPTTYIEPFGNVAIEAMACGTPAITTDWGAFTETVIDGVTGYRCRSFAQLVAAAQNAHKLDPVKIRRHAVSNYGIEKVGLLYEEYFERLYSLWGKGWYEKPDFYRTETQKNEGHVPS